MLVFDKIGTFSENCYFYCKMFVFAENALIFAPIFMRGDTEKPALCDLEARVLGSVERVSRECFA